jgi:hypothetical protein
MKGNNTKSALQIAGAGVLALALAANASAAPARNNNSNNGRNDNNRGRTESRSNNNSSYRDNQRVNATGKVSSFARESGGYRVQLDRGRESYWIPESHMGNRGRNLRVGVQIVLGGVYRGGRVNVDAVNWPNDGGYRDDYVRGIVERVDFRNGTLLLRDSSTRQTITVDMRDTRNSSRIDLGDLRRGDSVTLSGQWLRGGRFVADGIESANSRR